MKTSSYIYRNSLYHKADARAKLIFTAVSIIVIFLSDSLLSVSILALFSLLLSLYSLGWKETVLSVRRILPVIILLYLFSPFQEREGIALLMVGNTVLLTEEGLIAVTRLALRFLFLSMILVLFISGTRSEEIIGALRYFHMPYNAALLFSMILRFIPYLGGLFEDIRDSMSLRLTEKKRGFPILPSITAFAISAIRMIPTTAGAMEERGFGNGNRKWMPLAKCRRLWLQIAIGAMLPLCIFYFARCL